MKTLLAVACLTLLSCASSGKTEPGMPGILLVQMIGPSELNYPVGNFDVQYGMRITNTRDEPITLRQVSLEPVGRGGPYFVRRDHYYFRQEIAAQSAGDLAFWAHASATGNAFSIDAHAPVTIRAIVYFDSPTGGFRKVMMANLPQSGR